MGIKGCKHVGEIVKRHSVESLVMVHCGLKNGELDSLYEISGNAKVRICLFCFFGVLMSVSTHVRVIKAFKFHPLFTGKTKLTISLI